MLQSPRKLIMLMKKKKKFDGIKKRKRTAGRAKKEMPRRAQKAAITFPGHVSGVLSPYPTVDKVI